VRVSTGNMALLMLDNVVLTFAVLLLHGRVQSRTPRRVGTCVRCPSPGTPWFCALFHEGLGQGEAPLQGGVGQQWGQPACSHTMKHTRISTPHTPFVCCKSSTISGAPERTLGLGLGAGLGGREVDGMLSSSAGRVAPLGCSTSPSTPSRSNAVLLVTGLLMARGWSAALDCPGGRDSPRSVRRTSVTRGRHRFVL
jgi:hypothetical protein